MAETDRCRVVSIHRSGFAKLRNKMPRRLAIVVVAAGLLWVGGHRPALAQSAPADTILEAVPALPSALAADASGNGYENKEYNVATTGTLVRYPYSAGASNTFNQDVKKFEPYLAERYEISPDGLVYTFYLRKGLLSHSGNELTADDVLWSYERKWARGTTGFVNAPVITDPAKQFKKLDDHAVSITLARKSDGFTLLGLLSQLTGGIYDSKLLRQHVTADDPFAVKWSANNGGFGFGPFMLKSFTPGQELVLVANPNAVFKPKIQRIIQRVVSDPGTRASLLVNGDADVAVQLRPADIEQLAKSGKAQTFQMPTNNMVWLYLRTNGKPFDDIAVRRALSYAIPYERIVSEVYKGRASIMKSLINPIYPGATDNLPDQVYDPERARQILKDAGYQGRVPFTLTFSNAVTDMKDIFLQIQTFAAPAGFDVQANVLPPSSLAQILGRGNFEAFIERDFAATQSPPFELLLLLNKGSPYNRSKWEDQDYYNEVNAGIDAGDPLSPAAAAHWSAAQRLWRERVPYITIATVEPLMAFSMRLRGFAHRSDNVIDFSIVSKD